MKIFGDSVVLQAEAAECGLACLAMAASEFGHEETLPTLRRRFPTSMTGTNLRALMSIAHGLGFVSRAVRCDLQELDKLSLPAILHWDLDHYVLLVRVGAHGATIKDPARGRRRIPLTEISDHFTGVALELTPAPHFQRKQSVERVRIGDLWSRIAGLAPIVAQILLLSLLLQFAGLLSPLSSQIVIDQVIGSGDRSLLLVVMVSFGGLMAIQTVLELLRGFVQLHVGQRLSIQLSGNLLRHLLRLPVDYFERRHVGDVMTRFGSLGPVQTFLTAGAVGIILDGLIIVPLAVVMFLYSWKLSLAVCAGVLISLVARALAFPVNRRFTEDQMNYSARTQSVFLETVRAIRSIKIASRETERHAIWQNAVTTQLNNSFQQSRFNLWGKSGLSVVQGGISLCLLYLGAVEVISAALTLGMFFAFQSYSLQFATRAGNLIDQWISFRMLGLHLERLADIVHSDAEPLLDQSAWHNDTLTDTSLSIVGLSFRYAPQDPLVFDGISFEIPAGSITTIVGPSGGGKSTLLKLLIGLYLPGSGTITVGGRSLSTWGLQSYRSQVGVVMQDDQLLSGTVADNVAFFDAHMDYARVEECCQRAHVHEDIIQMPLGYHSLIGDMGSTLSGGQRQRILLARALYKQPSILFMDEGTANLDPALEAAVLRTVKELGCTVVMVAHREAAIEVADQIFRLEGSRLHQYVVEGCASTEQGLQVA